jgi:hypothetical protein
LSGYDVGIDRFDAGSGRRTAGNSGRAEERAQCSAGSKTGQWRHSFGGQGLAHVAIFRGIRQRRKSNRRMGLRMSPFFRDQVDASRRWPRLSVPTNCRRFFPSWRRTPARTRFWKWCECLIPIWLLFDDLGTQPLVDPTLDRGAVAVLLADRARQLDELLAKAAGALTVTNVVFDVPESVVDWP